MSIRRSIELHILSKKGKDNLMMRSMKLTKSGTVGKRSRRLMANRVEHVLGTTTVKVG